MKNIKSIIVLTIIIFLLISACIAAYFITKNNSNTSNMSNKEITQIDKLKTYLLGKDKTGRSLWEIYNKDSLEFLDDSSTVDVNETEALPCRYLNRYWISSDKLAETTNYYLYFINNEEVYRLAVNIRLSDSYTSTQSLEKVFSPNDNSLTIGDKTYKEGDSYTITGSTGSLEGTIIKIDTESNSMSVVTNDALKIDDKTIPLGYKDNSEIVINCTDQDNNEVIGHTDKSLVSYNNAVDTINKACATALNQKIGDNTYTVRSVGMGEDVTTTYCDYLPEEWSKSEGFSLNNTAKNGDTLAEEDIIRMSYYTYKNNPLKKGCPASNNEDYWITTRIISGDQTEISLGFGIIHETSHRYKALMNFNETAHAYGYSGECAVRPVIIINN